MKKQFLTLLIIFASILLSGCYPEGAEYVEDIDVVISKYNDQFDFTAKKTYAMPDKIVKITGNISEGENPVYLPAGTAAKILAMIDANMSSNGWTKVDISAKPDMLLAPASWETTTIYYYYDYWGWWYGGYYPGWGYGGYYPPVYGGSYTTGTLLMTLVDPNVVEGTGNFQIQWAGALNGLLNDTFNSARVQKGIDQAFTQSPYLKIN
jgi:hypothetical protein